MLENSGKKEIVQLSDSEKKRVKIFGNIAGLIYIIMYFYLIQYLFPEEIHKFYERAQKFQTVSVETELFLTNKITDFSSINSVFNVLPQGKIKLISTGTNLKGDKEIKVIVFFNKKGEKEKKIVYENNKLVSSTEN